MSLFRRRPQPPTPPPEPPTQQSLIQNATSMLETHAALLSCASRQQVQLNLLREVAGHAGSQSKDLLDALRQVTDSLERLRLVSLNIGLEGARLGDPTARALIGAADDIRAYVDRAVEALQELHGMLSESHRSWSQIVEQGIVARASASDVVEHARTAQDAAQQILSDVQLLNGKANLQDMTAAQLAARAVRHLDALSSILSVLGGKSWQHSRSMLQGLRGMLSFILKSSSKDSEETSNHGPGQP